MSELSRPCAATSIRDPSQDHEPGVTPVTSHADLLSANRHHGHRAKSLWALLGTEPAILFVTLLTIFWNCIQGLHDGQMHLPGVLTP